MAESKSRLTMPSVVGMWSNQNSHTQLVRVSIGIPTLKNCLAISTKVEYLHTIPIYFIHGNIPPPQKKITYMYEKIYTKFGNNPKIHQQAEIQSYSGILHSNEKQPIADKGNSMSESHKRDTEQKMPNTRPILHVFISQ